MNYSIQRKDPVFAQQLWIALGWVSMSRHQQQTQTSQCLGGSEQHTYKTEGIASQLLHAMQHCDCLCKELIIHVFLVQSMDCCTNLDLCFVTDHQ